jgi:hypothetical protein
MSLLKKKHDQFSTSAVNRSPKSLLRELVDWARSINRAIPDQFLISVRCIVVGTPSMPADSRFLGFPVDIQPWIARTQSIGNEAELYLDLDNSSRRDRYLAESTKSATGH